MVLPAGEQHTLQMCKLYCPIQPCYRQLHADWCKRASAVAGILQTVNRPSRPSSKPWHAHWHLSDGDSPLQSSL